MLGFLAGPLVKWLVFAAVVAAIFGAGTRTGYKWGYSSATEEMTEKMEAIQKSLDDVKANFAAYQLEQNEKIRKIETDSTQVAISAQKNAETFRQKAVTAQTKYSELAAARKEPAATLSTAALDTINSLVSDFQSEEKP